LYGWLVLTVTWMLVVKETDLWVRAAVLDVVEIGCDRLCPT
jgi:hypothetical protein